MEKKWIKEPIPEICSLWSVYCLSYDSTHYLLCYQIALITAATWWKAVHVLFPQYYQSAKMTIDSTTSSCRLILNGLAPTVSTGSNKQAICLKCLERTIAADSMFLRFFFAWHSVDLHVCPRRREAKWVKHREEREGGREESKKEVKGWPNPQIWLHHQRRGKQEMNPNLSAALTGLRNPGELWGNNLKLEIKEKMFTAPPGPVYTEHCRLQDRPSLEP